MEGKTARAISEQEARNKQDVEAADETARKRSTRAQFRSDEAPAPTPAPGGEAEPAPEPEKADEVVTNPQA